MVCVVSFGGGSETVLQKAMHFTPCDKLIEFVKVLFETDRRAVRKAEALKRLPHNRVDAPFSSSALAKWTRYSNMLYMNRNPSITRDEERQQSQARI